MARNIKYFLILFPGILWISAGMKLLLKATAIALDPLSSFFTYCLLFMVSWGLASLKHRYLLSKTIRKQLSLSSEFFSQKITWIAYIKQTFISRRFLIMVIMIAFFLVLRRYISNPQALFVIRATVGYALIKTAIAYFSKLQNALMENPEGN